ncbi:hypothetical protein P692DRAFT_20824298 [Suillus brevipes Sb2]|nr:hypothetical protein P692DRAFT_20824298 [Suillus brevipes Sb2]
MNRIQNVFHHFSLVRVDDTNQIVGNQIGDPIQVQWVDEPGLGRASLFVPRVDLFLRTHPVLGVAPNEGELFQLDPQLDGSYVIRSVIDNVNRLVLNNPAGPITIEPAPLVGAPDFNKQFWRLVAPRPEFRIQNVFDGRFIAVIQDPGNIDNWLVVVSDEGSLFWFQSVNLGQATLYTVESVEYLTIDAANRVQSSDNEQAARVLQFDRQDDESYVIHPTGDNINRLVLNDVGEIMNEPAPPPGALDFNKQFWRLVAPPA